MSNNLRVVGIDTEASQDYILLRVFLENSGSYPVRSGTVLARQTSKDGSIRFVEFFNSVDLQPGEKTRVSRLLSAIIKEVEFKTYRQVDGQSIPLSGTVRRTHFPTILGRWRLY
jgi:hypothetical protein